MEASYFKAILRAQQFAVAVGVLLIAVKFGAYYFTHSTTILTDALEGVVNILAGSFALFSLSLSAKPKDEDHPYGHGKVEFISAGLEGILIIAASLFIIVQAAYSFFRPVPLAHLGIGMALIAVTGMVNFALGLFLERRAKQHFSVALEADGKHLKSDAYISAALLLGVFCIWLTHIQWLDSAIAVIAAIFIAFTGYKLLRKSLVGIMDETDVAIVAPMVKHLYENRAPSWIDLHNARVIQYGSTLHLDCHITFPWYWNLEEVHREIDVVAETVNMYYPRPVEAFIHPDPCVSESCRLCKMVCDRRQHTFEREVVWTIENAVPNRKHRLE